MPRAAHGVAMARMPLVLGVVVSLAWLAFVPAPSAARGTAPVRLHTFDQARRLDVNRLNLFVANDGSFGNNAGNAGLYYPRGTTHTLLFQGGLWLGAESPTRVTVSEYS